MVDRGMLENMFEYYYENPRALGLTAAANSQELKDQVADIFGYYLEGGELVKSPRFASSTMGTEMEAWLNLMDVESGRIADPVAAVLGTAADSVDRTTVDNVTNGVEANFDLGDVFGQMLDWLVGGLQQAHGQSQSR